MPQQDEPTTGLGPCCRPAPAAADKPRQPPRPMTAGRRRLWELEDKHHCPVIGTCLSMEELTRFAQRFGFVGNLRHEYELHVVTVGMVAARNPVSELIQKHLDRKYARYRTQFDKAKTDAEVRALWHECLAQGEVAGPLWAALTHKAASEETRQFIYADIHMLSHQVGAGQAADARRLAHFEKENTELKRCLERERRERMAGESSLRERLHKSEAGQSRLLGAAEAAKVLTRRLTELESGAALRDLEQRLQTLQTDYVRAQAAARSGDELERNLFSLRKELDEMRAERDELAAGNRALERLLSAGIAGESDGDPCTACAWAAPERCVLCVGGRTALVAHYRDVAERLGIRLLHHGCQPNSEMSPFVQSRSVPFGWCGY